LWWRRTDIVPFFHHHASNGPTEAINCRLEALRRNAVDSATSPKNRWRSLLHSGAPPTHQWIMNYEEPPNSGYMDHICEDGN
jgi:hypothetical protein